MSAGVGEPASVPVSAGIDVVPARRLAAFYFWYYAAIGTLVPYLGLYLYDRGLDAWHVGLAVGLLSVTRIFAPYLWGWVADRYGGRMQWIRLSFVLPRWRWRRQGFRSA